MLCFGAREAFSESCGQWTAFARVKDGAALFADDTPLKMLAPGNKKTKTARIWAYVRDERPWHGQSTPCAWYQFTVDRRGEHPVKHLSG
jgi:transposase